MQGFLFKYRADRKDRFLRDEGGFISDPDFWSNRDKGKNIPVWAVCGVRLRQKLNEDDIVFFIPQKDCYHSNLKPYQLTGVLVCKNKMDKDDILNHESLTSDYRKRYEKDLNGHLKKDKPSTKKIRIKNVVLGAPHPIKSRWFGHRPIPIDSLLEKLGLTAQLKNLPKGRNNLIPSLKEEESKRLYDEVIKISKPSNINDPYPVAPSKMLCHSCYKS